MPCSMPGSTGLLQDLLQPFLMVLILMQWDSMSRDPGDFGVVVERVRGVRAVSLEEAVDSEGDGGIRLKQPRNPPPCSAADICRRD